MKRVGEGSFHVDRWHGVIGDSTLADAILDRLVHNAHRIQLKASPCASSAPPIRHRLTKPPDRERSHQTSRGSATPADINRNGWPTSNRNRWPGSSRNP